MVFVKVQTPYNANRLNCRLPRSFHYIDHCEPVRNVRDIVLDFSESHTFMLHYMVCSLLEIYDKHFKVCVQRQLRNMQEKGNRKISIEIKKDFLHFGWARLSNKKMDDWICKKPKSAYAAVKLFTSSKFSAWQVFSKWQNFRLVQIESICR